MTDKTPAPDLEALHELYTKTTGKNVPARYKNDAVWLQGKIDENDEEAVKDLDSVEPKEKLEVDEVLADAQNRYKVAFSVKVVPEDIENDLAALEAAIAEKADAIAGEMTLSACVIEEDDKGCHVYYRESGEFIRTYSEENHGENFKALAEEFANNHGRK